MAQAEDDVADIWSFIAETSPERADAFVRRVEETFEPLRHQPEMGPARHNLAPGLRIHFHEKSVICYRDDGNRFDPSCASSTGRATRSPSPKHCEKLNRCRKTKPVQRLWASAGRRRSDRAIAAVRIGRWAWLRR
ncbi:MAG: type II toxin-antitoxin system RelE/ParE family toxin [Verrucomicrobia bacterium]|nr:type II toxin-antitoxin system RelE/ParE family toxin [Verrucomicrobiota bacterium]